MGLWVLFDIEILDDPPFVALAAADPAHPWRWMRIVQFAKRANEKGRVLRADGRPVTTRDLALTHDRTTSTEDAWQDLVAKCLEEGLLVDEEGTLSIRDWRRWHRKPSDDPESIRERVSRHRAKSNADVTPVTRSNACNASEAEAKAEAKHEQQQQQSIAHAREGLAAAAGSDDYIGSGNGLEPIRPAIAQAMQRLGILAAPSGTWWTSVTAWAAPAIAGGATLDDVQDAIRYGADKSAHDRPRRPWPYAMTIASEEIGQIARRNQMRRDWEANGRRGPEPLPYVWTPEEDTCSR